MSPSRRQLLFAKYSGAGNDFLIVDERHEPGVGEGSQLARALCRRGTSVGADGLLVLTMSDTSNGSAGRMRLWNADGSRAEFSGNAARCAVRYLVDEELSAADKVKLETDIGLVTGRVDGSESGVVVPGVARVYSQRRLRVEGHDLQGTYVTVGVPFFVLLHDDPESLPVRYLGRAIRQHGDLAPAGANVDFVRVDDEQNLTFRVYERGVEAETLSSGTGSISAALAAAAAGRVESPVVCNARGGSLTVRFRELKPAEIAALTADEESPPEEIASPAAESGAESGSESRPESDDAEPDAADSERAESAGPPLPKVAAGEPAYFGDIQVVGETRRVMTGTAHAEALRLR